MDYYGQNYDYTGANFGDGGLNTAGIDYNQINYAANLGGYDYLTGGAYQQNDLYANYNYDTFQNMQQANINPNYEMFQQQNIVPETTNNLNNNLNVLQNIEPDVNNVYNVYNIHQPELNNVNIANNLDANKLDTVAQQPMNINTAEKQQILEPNIDPNMLTNNNININQLSNTKNQQQNTNQVANNQQVYLARFAKYYPQSQIPVKFCKLCKNKGYIYVNGIAQKCVCRANAPLNKPIKLECGGMRCHCIIF